MLAGTNGDPDAAVLQLFQLVDGNDVVEQRIKRIEEEIGPGLFSQEVIKDIYRWSSYDETDTISALQKLNSESPSVFESETTSSYDSVFKDDIEQSVGKEQYLELFRDVLPDEELTKIWNQNCESVSYPCQMQSSELSDFSHSTENLQFSRCISETLKLLEKTVVGEPNFDDSDMADSTETAHRLVDTGAASKEVSKPNSSSAFAQELFEPESVHLEAFNVLKSMFENSSPNITDEELVETLFSCEFDIETAANRLCSGCSSGNKNKMTKEASPSLEYGSYDSHNSQSFVHSYAAVARKELRNTSLAVAAGSSSRGYDNISSAIPLHHQNSSISAKNKATFSKSAGLVEGQIAVQDSQRVQPRQVSISSSELQRGDTEADIKAEYHRREERAWRLVRPLNICVYLYI